MTSIDLLRTLNDEELIAFIKMMSGSTEKFSCMETVCLDDNEEVLCDIDLE